jgi:hypothetical protein
MRKAWAPIVIAIMCGCGAEDDGSSTGSSGTGGAGGATTGTAGTAGASGAGGTTDDGGTGAGGASGTGGAGGAAGKEGGAGKGGAGKDGGAGSGGAGAGGTAGMGGGAGKDGGGTGGSAGKDGGGAGGAAGTIADVGTPPMPDVTQPPIDGSSDPADLIRELVARLKPEDFDAKCHALEMMSQPNRKTKTANYTAATEWIKGWLATEAPSASVTFDDWSGSRNIEIKIAGSDPTAGIYVIGGHLDSVAVGPGMDDDGSGALGVAMLASAMSHYRYSAEIRLLVFDGEEDGWVGSAHYAKALTTAGCQNDTCMKLFINMDMIGYDPRDTGAVKVEFNLAGPKMVADQVKGYVPGLTITPGTGNCHSSDDCGFSENGFANAGELLEPNFNQQWHKVGDTCDILNYKTANKVMQLAGAMLATMGGIYSRAP